MAKQEGKIDMQAIMEIYKKVGTPGEPHKLLAKLKGSWTTRTRGWMEPDKPPIDSTGTCEQKLVLMGITCSRSILAICWDSHSLA